MAPPPVGGVAKLHQEGQEMGAAMPTTTGRDSVEDRGRVSVAAFVAYTMPRPRKYQAVVMTDSLTGSWEC